MVRLRELGWDAGWQARFDEVETAAGWVPARVSEESQGLYRVLAESGEYLAGIAGRLRRGSGGRSDLPAVGDWVAVAPRPDEGRATIVRLLPRRTALARKMAGRGMDAQILAANLDIVFVVTSLNRELNLRRIERYLALAWESGAEPVVLLTKADLCGEPAAVRAEVESRAPGVMVCVVSAVAGFGCEAVEEHLRSGRSGAFIGSSGVGKTTLLNVLLGSERLAVGAIRGADDRGRHTTTARQLLVLPGGGVVIDTPGMREIQLWESESGLARTFDDLAALAERCRFRDCRHLGEPGCAVAAAVASGALPQERLENHRKMAAELRFLAARADPQAQREEKQRVKTLCKAQKRLYR
jgi:ribosome biogenesis GTPase / thiamine phosphate phosphatase